MKLRRAFMRLMEPDRRSDVRASLVLLAVALVLYVPALQRAFGTVALGAADWLRCLAVASSVLWVREAAKLAARLASRHRETL